MVAAFSIVFYASESIGPMKLVPGNTACILPVRSCYLVAPCCRNSHVLLLKKGHGAHDPDCVYMTLIYDPCSIGLEEAHIICILRQQRGFVFGK